MKIVTATQMAELDHKTIEEHGIPGETLMERAGKGIFKYVKGTIGKFNLTPYVLLFAGRGNNGGDAFVVARYLQQDGIKNTTVLLTDEKELKGDAQLNYLKLKGLGAEIITITSTPQLESIAEKARTCGIIVDGILGTGIKGAVEGFYADVVNFINSQNKTVIAIDIPSGISGNTGIEDGVCIDAYMTVTMGLPKEGCFLGKSLNHLGKLKVVDIGIPKKYIDEAESKAGLLTEAEVAPLFPKRKRISHKGDYGRTFVLAGSRGYTGAAVLLCQAAMRTGSGLVYLGIPHSLNTIMEMKLTEPMTVPLEETPEGTTAYKSYGKILGWFSKVDSAVIGPGLSTNPDTAKLVIELLQGANIPLTIDADGLNCLKGQTDYLRRYKGPLIVTPHPGEMSRLIGLPIDEIEKSRWEIAKKFARQNKAVTVLKGAQTTIADPEGNLFVNIVGNAGMASGGVGDVLTGIIGSLVGQRLSPLDAAKLGVFLHGTAGDLAAEKVGEPPLIASDLIEVLPEAIKTLQSRR